MSSEPDVFKKLDALLNKHRQNDAAASPDDAIPTLLEVVDDAPEPAADAAPPELGDDAPPVLTEIISDENTADTVIEELELDLDLEFISDDDPGPLPEPLMAAELPDVWERNEHEFDAETTHGFGLSAFSREAAAEARKHEWSEPQPETDTAPPQLQPDDAVIDVSGLPAETDATTPEPSTTVIEPATPSAAEAIQASPETVQSDSTDEIPADDWGNPAAEVAISDALAERALRDLDRHIAQVLENQVGPQLAQRLDLALASMLEQFSTNLESLIREAVREEMRRYFDGDSQ